jgi:quinoprotein glucose dehydrogenase
MAFDVKTGKLVWSFHTIPHQGEAGDDTWGNPNISQSTVVGAANSWAGMSLDVDREILYVPTGSAAPDFYGVMRPGKNLFSNCLLALNANTGKLIWHYQFTHHDLWDRDLPAPPNLLTVNHGGKSIPAVAQITKQGFVFLFDRLTGEPLFDIEEVPVPRSDLPGEQTWPTQPIPVKPVPFARQSNDLTAEDISPYAPNRDILLLLFEQADKRRYAPPSLKPVLLLPGYDGAAEWGGAGADPDKGILYINSNEMAWFLQMKKSNVFGAEVPQGERIYRQNCASCHKINRAGIALSGYPSLVGVSNRLSEKQIQEIITRGKGIMPGFPQLSTKDRQILINFLTDKGNKNETSEGIQDNIEETFLPFKFTGYNKFLDKNGLPAIAPPWGTLQALDLNTGEYLWKVPLGETVSLRNLGYPTTGTENYGGPVVTKNGLLFIAATKDGYIRSFDKKTGSLIWEFELPAPAFATPSIYAVDGKQYLVIACGGEKLQTKKGNKIIAFALEKIEKN